MYENKRKGDIALSKAIAYFIEKGCEVLLPVGDRRPYDLVVEFEDGTLKKVQCKYTSYKSPAGNYVVPLRVMGGNRTRNKAVKYNKDDFDIIFIYTAAKDLYCIPFNEVEATAAFIINNTRDKWKVNQIDKVDVL